MAMRATFSTNVTVACVYQHREKMLSLVPFLKKIAHRFDGSTSSELYLAEMLRAHEMERGFFDFDPSNISGSLMLKSEHLFPQRNPISRVMFRRLSGSSNETESLLAIDLDDADSNDELMCVAALLRSCVQSPAYRGGNWLTEAPDVDQENIEDLISQGILTHEDDARTGLDDFEGVLRLQHASMLFRSGKIGVLVDPHLHSTYGRKESGDNVSANQIIPLVDVVVLSHLHLDHYNLATLMMFPLDTTIIIPKVSRQSLLCDDIYSRLTSIGFSNVVELEWYGQPFSIGGIEIQALPFFGEQPLRYEVPFDKDLRNWGNTYIIRTDKFATWLLIDSGNDVYGAMLEVAEEVKSRYGGVDAISSNLGMFTPYTPTYITGANEYWLCLTPDQRKRFNSMRDHELTLGPKGVAEICAAANARYFLPYAHWWGHFGTHPRKELRDVAQLELELKNVSASTIIVPWSVGDKLNLTMGGYETSPHVRSRAR